MLCSLVAMGAILVVFVFLYGSMFMATFSPWYDVSTMKLLIIQLMLIHVKMVNGGGSWGGRCGHETLGCGGEGGSGLTQPDLLWFVTLFLSRHCEPGPVSKHGQWVIPACLLANPSLFLQHDLS